MMKSLLGNSAMPNYVKITATGLLALTYIAALAVATAIYIDGGPNATLPNIITFILGTGIGLAANAIGLHTGASLAESSPLTVAPNTTSTTTQTNVTKEIDNASTPTA